MNTKEFKELKELLSAPKNICIITHKSADGDAMGSSLGLYAYLLKKNHRVQVITPDAYPDFLKWLPGNENVIQFDRNINKSKNIIRSSDIIFLMDFNELSRTGDALSEILTNFKGIFVMIDHHENPDNVAHYLFSDTSACATAQMTYHFLENMNELHYIDKTIATCLYTGIMTDTGSFRFPNTGETAFRIASELIKAGADNAVIYDKVFNNYSLGRMQLLGKALQQLKVLEEYRTAYIVLTEEDKKNHHFRKGDTEGFVNYALSIKNIVFGVIFIEDKIQNIIKISFRSKGNFAVNEFAAAHFHGGGHRNAAGGRSELDMHETLAKFTNLLDSYREKLLHSYDA